MTEGMYRPDPYDEMSDEEFSDLVVKLFDRKKKKSVGVTLRWDKDELSRIRRLAAARGVPYQTFIKQAANDMASRMEQRGNVSADA